MGQWQDRRDGQHSHRNPKSWRFWIEEIGTEERVASGPEEGGGKVRCDEDQRPHSRHTGSQIGGRQDAHGMGSHDGDYKRPHSVSAFFEIWISIPQFGEDPVAPHVSRETE